MLLCDAIKREMNASSIAIRGVLLMVPLGNIYLKLHGCQPAVQLNILTECVSNENADNIE